MSDERGTIVKTFQRKWFFELGLCTDWREQYVSVSRERVIRGLHFQLPPHDHVKLVCCVAGSVLDVVLDLRRDSPTFGQHTCLTLCAKKGNMVYLSSGLAHGFLTLSDSATLVYNVSSEYEPTHDTGIRWDSAAIDWPEDSPILTERDKAFVSLAAFESPFTFLPNTSNSI